MSREYKHEADEAARDCVDQARKIRAVPGGIRGMGLRMVFLLGSGFLVVYFFA